MSNQQRNSDLSSLVDTILENLTSESLKQYGKLFLANMSRKSIDGTVFSEMLRFLESRFEFFEQAVNEPFQIRITPRVVSAHQEKMIVMDVVYPDVPYALMTIDSLLRDMELRIIRKIHMIAAIEAGPDKHILHSPHDARYPQFCHVYIELEYFENAELLDRLRLRIEAHLQAAQQINRDKNAMLRLQEEIRRKVDHYEEDLPEPQEEWLNLLEWMGNQNFTLMGYICYNQTGKTGKLSAEPERCLGILSQEYQRKYPSRLQDILTAHIWKNQQMPSPFHIDTLKAASPVLSLIPLMCMGFRFKEPDGSVSTHVLVGLIRRSSLHVKNIEMPLIHLKMKYIFEQKHLVPDSYEYNAVIRAFSAIPKHELFRSSAANLLQRFDDLQSINAPDRIHCFQYRHPSKNQVHFMIVVPSQIFTENNLEKIIECLEQQVPHEDMEVIQVQGEEKNWIDMYFDLHGDTSWTLDITQLEETLSALVQPWNERLRHVLREDYADNIAQELFDRYVALMPEHYRVRTSPQDAVRDIRYFEKAIHERELQYNLVPFTIPTDLAYKVSLFYVYSLEKIDLNHIMPVLQNMGLYVIDQLTVRIGDYQHTLGFLQTFRVQSLDEKRIDEEKFHHLLGTLLVKVLNQATENDPLNALALNVGLNWRSINVLMAYRNLYLQLGASVSRQKIHNALLSHPRSTRMLFELFETRFSPDDGYGSREYRQEILVPELKQHFLDSLADVEDVEEDLVFRRLFNLIEHTLRTSFYTGRVSDSSLVAFKLDSAKVDHMPVPAPFREIYIHDVGFEGTHLRFGRVARGGIRWSDRPDDFRKEILGLVKTQQKKNVVIVPVGSKGGFVIKKQPASRDLWLQEGQHQYEKFISALLDLTDNVDARGHVTHPAQVMVYDEQDAYLVVAADKGTASFSDFANAISGRYQFWLGDAFASGGSVGYDHKKEGITARGAWECVKLHFHEMGHDIQTQITSVTGVGDMSGDVFGNGMLLSRVLKLRAAFNHAHIFLDPDPDPETSWTERKRMFDLPRSTWKDYNTQLISAGGGVYDRKAKGIKLSNEVRQMLGISSEYLTGDEMVRALLKMETDLLWLGGIGTYIKASQESHAQVGDQANDAVRIDATECRAKVIGEGANLGLTQLGRIEFNRAGGKLNTDAIDNSAGVNMSDYEVNLKILLQQMLRSGEFKNIEERNQTLRAATDQVSRLVLENNIGQHQSISMDSLRSNRQLRTFSRLIASLETQGMSRRSEFIPIPSELAKLEHEKAPLPRPVLAVVLAYAKMGIYEALLKSTLCEDPFLRELYEGYFPETILERCRAFIDQHQLKRQIIATVLTNSILNEAGSAFFFQVGQSCQQTVEVIARAYLLVYHGMNGVSLMNAVRQRQGVRQQQKYDAVLLFQERIKSLTEYLLSVSREGIDLADLAGFKNTLDQLFQLYREVNKEKLSRDSSVWEQSGFSKETSQALGLLQLLDNIPEVLYLHRQEKQELNTALRVTLLLDDLLGFGWIRERLNTLTLQNEWEQTHQEMLIQSLETSKRKIFHGVIQSHAEGTLQALTSERLLGTFKHHHPQAVAGYFQTLEQLRYGAPVNLSTLAVCLHRLGFLAPVTL
ncbi:MAG: NAD-glutamate dehydrogenase [SAR324 cluster bacterium]|nr:NAD-glutamate dehydrogenase [SAR324 cluster bacterium]